jgi:hypothetical protein
MARCLALTSIKDANYDPVVGLTAVHCMQLRDGCFWEKIKMMKSLGKKMMRTVRYRAIAAIIPACLLSVVMLIFADNVAQAKSRTAAACGKELQSQCIGTPSFGSNMLACLAKAQVSARCRAVAQNVVRSCERDAVQFCQGVAFGQGNILGCLTAARGVVSAPCNAALNAVFVR